MKKTIFAGSILMLLCSCSLSSRFNLLKPKNVGSYEITSHYYHYEIEIYNLNLYDKKRNLKDSIRFYYDIESKKLKRYDNNGNIRINANRFSSQKIPKYFTPLIQEI